MNPLANIKDNELTHELYVKGCKQAEAERDWIICDKQREIVLNTVASSYKGDSVSESMRKARISKEYQAHVNLMGELKFEVILARTKYAAIEFEIRMRINNSFRQQADFKSGHIVT